jgi:RNA polymerase sigma-70 factor (ECF subfamily)
MSPNISDSTSSSLISRIRRRDDAAWEQFADIYAPLVYSWARRGGLRDNDAADLVQEVFRTVATKIDDFGVGRDQPSFRGWLWAITRNRLRLFYRQLEKRPEATGGTDAARRLEQLPDWIDHQDDPTTGDERTNLAQRILTVIRGDFDEKTWRAFWRMAIDEHSATEIAEDLKTTPAAVRQAKYRVLCRLRDELSVG